MEDIELFNLNEKNEPVFKNEYRRKHLWDTQIPIIFLFYSSSSFFFFEK